MSGERERARRILKGEVASTFLQRKRRERLERRAQWERLERERELREESTSVKDGEARIGMSRLGRKVLRDFRGTGVSEVMQAVVEEKPGWYLKFVKDRDEEGSYSSILLVMRSEYDASYASEEYSHIHYYGVDVTSSQIGFLGLRREIEVNGWVVGVDGTLDELLSVAVRRPVWLFSKAD